MIWPIITASGVARIPKLPGQGNLCRPHPSAWLAPQAAAKSDKYVTIIPDRTFHTMSAVGLSRLVDKGATIGVLYCTGGTECHSTSIPNRVF